MIGCHEVEAARLELAGGAELSPEQRDAMAHHLDGCAPCQAFAQELDAIEASLQASLAADAEQATGTHAARFLEAVAREPAASPRASRVAVSSRAPGAPAFPFRAAGIVALAAGLLLAAGLGLLESPTSTAPAQLARGPEQRDYRPGEPLRPGDRVQVRAPAALTLPQAELTPAEGSALRVEQLTPMRVVTLEQGAVTCDVVPHSGPFQVRTPLGVVYVVGTRFVVTLGAQTLRVVVERGQVEVASLARPERVPVAAGQTAAVDAAGRIEVSGAASEPVAPASPQPTQLAPGPAASPAEGPAGVVPRLINADPDALFEVQGQAPWLPDGTSLHVNLLTPGMNKELRVAFFKVVCERGRFRGSFHWPDKRFAPLVYRVTVQLYVSTQPPGLRQALMRDLGLAPDAQLEVASAQVELGTSAEREEHARQSLDQVAHLIERARRLLDSGAQVPGLGEPGRDAPLARFRKQAEREQQEQATFAARFVVLREGDLLLELANVVMDAIQIVEAGGELDSLGSRLDLLSREIGTRRPQRFDLPDDR